MTTTDRPKKGSKAYLEEQITILSRALRRAVEKAEFAEAMSAGLAEQVTALRAEVETLVLAEIRTSSKTEGQIVDDALVISNENARLRRELASFEKTAEVLGERCDELVSKVDSLEQELKEERDGRSEDRTLAKDELDEMTEERDKLQNAGDENLNDLIDGIRLLCPELPHWADVAMCLAALDRRLSDRRVA